MKMRSNRSAALLTLLSQFVLIVVFSLFSLYLVARANGYLLNRTTLQLQQTGIVSLNVLPTPVTVTLNDTVKAYNQSDINISDVTPDHYFVEIAKPGYLTWTKSFDLAAGQVERDPFITLFLADGATSLATDNQVAALNAYKADPPQITDIDVRGNEIWVKPLLRTYPFTVSSNRFELVARFSGPVQSAQWFSGRSRINTNIIFQQGANIYVMDRDGTNNYVLATLSSSDPTDYIVDNDDNILIYKDGDKVLQRKLL